MLGSAGWATTNVNSLNVICMVVQRLVNAKRARHKDCSRCSFSRCFHPRRQNAEAEWQGRSTRTLGPGQPRAQYSTWSVPHTLAHTYLTSAFANNASFVTAGQCVRVFVRMCADRLPERAPNINRVLNMYDLSSISLGGQVVKLTQLTTQSKGWWIKPCQGTIFRRNLGMS